MCARFVDGSNEQAHSEGSLCWVSSLHLGLGCNFGNESLSWVLTAVSVPVVKALGAHVSAEKASVSCHAGDHNAHMLVNLEHFLLMDCELMRSFLQSTKHLQQKQNLVKRVNPQQRQSCPPESISKNVEHLRRSCQT